MKIKFKPRFSVWVKEYREKYPNIANAKSIKSLRKLHRELPCITLS